MRPRESEDETPSGGEESLVVNRRRFDEAVDRLHRLIPRNDPQSPLWDLWLEFVEVGRSG